MDPMSLASLNLGQSYNHSGISSEVFQSQNSNFSTRLAAIPRKKQAAMAAMSLAYPNLGQSYHQPGISNEVQSHNQPGMSRVTNGSGLKRKNSSSSEPERVLKKRETDKRYRERCKTQKMQMQTNMENLKGENDSLKKENESLKEDNSLMNQTLRDQEKEIELLKNDLFQLKREHGKQNVLVQTLSGLFADPMRLENKKLKEENASLKKISPLNSNSLQLAEENARLRIENKVLRVQNDALCEKIIRDNDNKHG